MWVTGKGSHKRTQTRKLEADGRRPQKWQTQRDGSVRQGSGVNEYIKTKVRRARQHTKPEKTQAGPAGSRGRIRRWRSGRMPRRWPRSSPETAGGLTGAHDTQAARCVDNAYHCAVGSHAAQCTTPAMMPCAPGGVLNWKGVLGDNCSSRTTAGVRNKPRIAEHTPRVLV